MILFSLKFYSKNIQTYIKLQECYSEHSYTNYHWHFTIFTCFITYLSIRPSFFMHVKVAKAILLFQHFIIFSSMQKSWKNFTVDTHLESSITFLNSYFNMSIYLSTLLSTFLTLFSLPKLFNTTSNPLLQGES